MEWAKATPAGGPARKVILLLLAEYADEDWSCYPGQERIARETDQGVRTVRRHLAAMEADGLLRRERCSRHDGSGWRTSDRYVLGPGALPANADTPEGLPANPGGPTGQSVQANRPSVAGESPGEHPGETPGNETTPAQPQLTLVVAGPPPPTFDDFWQAWPRERRTEKPKARDAWQRATRTTDPAAIVAGAERLATDPNRPEARYLPYPARWLSREGWNNPPYPVRGTGQASGADQLLAMLDRSEGAAIDVGSVLHHGGPDPKGLPR